MPTSAPTASSRKKIAVFLLLSLLALVYFFISGVPSLDVDALARDLASRPLHAVIVFSFVYIAIAAANLPGIGPLAVGAGVVFGFTKGIVLVSFCGVIGGCLSFLSARYLLRDWMQRRFANFLQVVNERIEEDGALYLFTLRILPFVPYFVINPVFGLTRMPLKTFYWVSQLGMLPLVLLYVNLGARVGSIDEFTWLTLLTPEVVISFTLFLIFPFVAKKVSSVIKARRA